MNVIHTTPDVKLFVTAVREHLGDLTEEEREELVGGLESDMSDLIEERGVEALPEPAAYAAELRSAAGFSSVAPSGGRRAPGFQEGATRLLDSARHRWIGFASGVPGQPWELVVALRPAWWVLRAWVLLQAVDLVWGGGAQNYGLSPIPSLQGWGLALLVAAVLVSVQVGRGRLWPGNPGRGLVARLLLLAVNVCAIALTPAALDGLITPAKAEMWANDTAYYPDAVATGSTGLSFNGRAVTNVFPYDAQGRPLVGVQLVDQDGRRLSTPEEVTSEDTGEVVFLAPWMNGRTSLFSVYPLPERPTDPDTGLPTDSDVGDPVGTPVLATPPFASLPPVSLSGTRPSALQTPAQAAAQAVAARKVARLEATVRAQARELRRLRD